MSKERRMFIAKETLDAFKKIVFGIYGGGINYEAFKKVFK